MEELLRFILTRITQYPQEVEIQKKENLEEGQVDFDIYVHSEDMGIVIGKKGKIVKSIRNLINVLAYPQNLYVQLNIREKGVEEKQEESRPKESEDIQTENVTEEGSIEKVQTEGAAEGGNILEEGVQDPASVEEIENESSEVPPVVKKMEENN